MQRRLIWLSLGLVASLLMGCSSSLGVSPTPIISAPSAVPTAPPAPATAEAAATEIPALPEPTASPQFDAAAVQAAIQVTLDRYSEAYNRNDIALLEQTVDQSNAPFRRLVEERFENYQNSITGGSFTLEYTVLTVNPRELGFVESEIVSAGGYRYRWTFREVQGAWLLSEPNAKQIGERYEIETEHFVVKTYPWADDVNQQIADLMEEAYTVVTTKLGAEPDFKPTVDVRPIFGITPPQSATALAYYRAGNRPREDRMVIFGPTSFAFGGYDPQKGWEGELRETLIHEFTHLVNNRAFMPVSTMRDWMYEGLAEYVAESPRASEVRAAVALDQIIPIVDPQGGVTPQDLDHLYLLERDRSLAYGLSYALVAYIIDNHGGLDGFWTLARTFNTIPGTGIERYDAALQASFGVGYAEFDAGWRAYLKATYGAD